MSRLSAELDTWQEMKAVTERGVVGLEEANMRS
jgi:hypothetical protein